ncbi:sigma-70 family RNA polymerase sigma factor [Sandaracinus amylolyticus]|nr:sigma-70 family RNA polymerase sigma factor [Sandaracinus amylolyticus]
MTEPSTPKTHPADALVMVRSFEQHRTALTGHCYRMLASAAEADDAVQETMVRAWRAIDRFEGRSSLRTWLYRIATRVCLDMLEDRARRSRSMDLGPPASLDAPLTALPASQWVEPIADARALPTDVDPAQLVALRQSIRLAFVAALQHLPPKQRAVLLLMEVLGWQASDVAESLETTVAAVNSALQRARATLATRDLETARAPLTDAQSSLVDRFVEAFERYDMDALTQLLHADVAMSMPPHSLWIEGPANVAAWMVGRGAACARSRLVPVEVCGSPAFAQYKPSEDGTRFTPWALLVLELEGERIAEMTFFLDVETLFPRLGLPAELR